MVNAIIAYYRVSTDGQAVLGLSLPAQRNMVRQYATENRQEVLGEYTEVESAYRAAKVTLEKRPQLRAALSLCKKTKATLVITALDRLARNVVFIASLVETRVRFVALDIPHATPFMLHIYAAVAEEESRQKGEILRTAIAVARSHGVVWAIGPRRKAEQARARAESIRSIVDDIRRSGIRGPSRMAKELNRRGVPRAPDKSWSTGTARMMLEYLGYYSPPRVPWSEISKREAKIRNDRFRSVARNLQRSGLSLRKVAAEMNRRGLVTARGLDWNLVRIKHLFDRHRKQRRRLA